MSDKIKTTGDNSPTLFSEQFQAHYHSIHGAWTETDVVFIRSGLDHVSQFRKNISILEIGFGTGLNCIATYLNAIKNQLNIDYTTLEKYPVSKDVILNFESQLESIPDLDLNIFRCSHEATWNEQIQISPNFQLTKLDIDFLDLNRDQTFDLIYFDAFAPETQPELWTVEMFELMADVLISGGILTTYCAKGYVKRNLKAAGFIVEALPGPPGKREITRAIKI